MLRHAHQRVIDRGIAMGVIFTDDIADDARRLAEWFVILIAVLMHRIENTAVHGLEAVAHIGQRPAHDHAHGVVEIRTLHLLRDRDRSYIGRLFRPLSARWWRWNIIDI